jgi:hypothetical protein
LVNAGYPSLLLRAASELALKQKLSLPVSGEACVIALDLRLGIAVVLDDDIPRDLARLCDLLALEDVQVGINYLYVSARIAGADAMDSLVNADRWCTWRHARLPAEQAAEAGRVVVAE